MERDCDRGTERKGPGGRVRGRGRVPEGGMGKKGRQKRGRGRQEKEEGKVREKRQGHETTEITNGICIQRIAQH